VGTFGERLRREREMRGVGLNEIAAATKIGTRSLKALEEEDFSKLPGGIFNKGFVRAYARFLGMNEDQAVADYVSAAGEAEQSSDAVMERLAAESERRAEEKRIERQREKAGGPLLTWNTIALVVVLAAVGLLGWEYFSHKRAKTEQAAGPAVTAPAPAPQQTVPTPVENPGAAANTPAGTPPATTSTPDLTLTAPAKDASAKPTSLQASPSATGSSGTPTSSTVASKTATTPAKPVAMPAQSEPYASTPAPTGDEFVVVVKATKQSWVSSRADDKPTPGRLLAANSEATFRARNNLRLLIGNAGGVEVSFNGKTLPVVGEENKSKTLIFTPAGPQQ